MCKGIEQTGRGGRAAVLVHGYREGEGRVYVLICLCALDGCGKKIDEKKLSKRPIM